MLSLYMKYLNIKNRLVDLNNEEGQGLVEYALILVLISLAVFAGSPTVATNIGNLFDNIATYIGDLPVPTFSS